MRERLRNIIICAGHICVFLSFLSSCSQAGVAQILTLVKTLYSQFRTCCRTAAIVTLVRASCWYLKLFASDEVNSLAGT